MPTNTIEKHTIPNTGIPKYALNKKPKKKNTAICLFEIIEINCAKPTAGKIPAAIPIPEVNHEGIAFRSAVTASPPNKKQTNAIIANDKSNKKPFDKKTSSIPLSLSSSA